MTPTPPWIERIDKIDFYSFGWYKKLGISFEQAAELKHAIQKEISQARQEGAEEKMGEMRGMVAAMHCGGCDEECRGIEGILGVSLKDRLKK